nr:hypothetical protein [Endozoicomonas acroporae]
MAFTSSYVESRFAKLILLFGQGAVKGQQCLDGLSLDFKSSGVESRLATVSLLFGQ